MEARRGAGGGGSDPSAGCCLVERSAGASSRRKATTRGPSRALKRPVASRVVNRCLRYDSAGPLSGQGRGQAFRQGPQTPQAAPRDGLAGLPAHPQHRRDLKRPAVAPGNQRGSPSRALAVDQRVPVAEAASAPGPSTRRRPTEPPWSPPLPCPRRRRPPAPRRGLPPAAAAAPRGRCGPRWGFPPAAPSPAQP